MKKYIPPAHYEVAGNLVNKKKKSNLDKAARTSHFDEVAKRNNYPAPNKYKEISYSLVHKKNQSCLGFKGDRVSFINDSEFKALTNPDVPDKISHKYTEKRASAAVYNPINKAEEKRGPSFLGREKATKLISPTTYNPQDSFMNTQIKKPRFYSAKGRNNSMVDQAIKRAQGTPGVGQYDVKSIDRGY